MPNGSSSTRRKESNEINGCFPVPYGKRLQGICKKSGNDSSNKRNKEQPTILNVANCNPSGHGMNGSVYFAEGLAPTLTTDKGEGIKVITIESEERNRE